MLSLSNYLAQNNLSDVITTWEEVCEFTGKTLAEIQNETGEQVEDLTIVSKPKKEKVLAAFSAVPTDLPGSLEYTLAQAIQPFIKAQSMDENRVIELVKQYAPVRAIEVKSAGGVHQISGVQHEKFEEILENISIKKHCYLVGPPGTGKSKIGPNVAKALGKTFQGISVCSQTTETKFFGFISANGNYVPTLFRHAYEHGGLFLVDEIDKGNPNILASLNSALEGVCAFPDKMIEMHPDFICIATANTYGTGATRQFVGSLQLDDATLNRFVHVEVDYDNELEFALFGEIARTVQNIRAQYAGDRVVISMRNTDTVMQLIAIGKSKEVAIQRGITNCIAPNLRKSIKII